VPTPSASLPAGTPRRCERVLLPGTVLTGRGGHFEHVNRALLGRWLHCDEGFGERASASAGRSSRTATRALYPASLAWSNGNSHGHGGGTAAALPAALAARPRASPAAVPSLRAVAWPSASMLASHAWGVACAAWPICRRARATSVSPRTGSPVSISNAARLPACSPPASRARPGGLRRLPAVVGPCRANVAHVCVQPCGQARCLAERRSHPADHGDLRVRARDGASSLHARPRHEPARGPM